MHRLCSVRNAHRRACVAYPRQHHPLFASAAFSTGILDDLPAPYHDSQASDRSSAFIEFVHARNLSTTDGQMLHTLRTHIMNGGHADYPRLRFIGKERCMQHMSKDYFISIDTACFGWLQRQKKAYRNRTIHPWVHWKLEQLNVTLEWTRQPIQDRDFRWTGEGGGDGDVEGQAECDPLFPLHSKDKPLLKFLNPFYEHWHASMPPTLKRLRLMNEKSEEGSSSLTDMDDIRATRIVVKWDTEAGEYRYYIGPREIDRDRMAADQQSSPMRTSYLSDDAYDRNSYSRAQCQQWTKEAASMSAEQRVIQPMNYQQARENATSLKASVEKARAQPRYSHAVRGEYYVEALKRELVKASHLELHELQLVSRHLRLELHNRSRQSSVDCKLQNGYGDSYSNDKRRTRAAHNKWTHYHGYESWPLFRFPVTQYDDVHGVFDALDTYHKTRHPGQPPWGAWDVAAPNFDVENLQSKIEAWLQTWRASAHGQQFVAQHLKRTFGGETQKHVALRQRLSTGVELLNAEMNQKQQQIAECKLFRDKFNHSNATGKQVQCKEKAMEIQKLQAECLRIAQIIHEVDMYNEL